MLLLAWALTRLCRNRTEDQAAGIAAEEALAAVEEALVTLPETVPPQETTPTPNPEMPVAEIDGYGYVGYLELPALELTLPVMSEWDYERLNIAPCRQFGSSRTDDLVIAAHNYYTHFGGLHTLTEGDSVRFTDMDGLCNDYTVRDIRILDPTDLAAVRDSGYALVLYTCSYNGQNRVTVFCEREEAGLCNE